jgi:hypothetical protein
MVESRALTVGEIGRRLDRPIWWVDYMVRSRGIAPIQRAGNLRVFSGDVLDFLRRERQSQAGSTDKKGAESR